MHLDFNKELQLFSNMLSTGKWRATLIRAFLTASPRREPRLWEGWRWTEEIQQPDMQTLEIATHPRAHLHWIIGAVSCTLNKDWNQARIIVTTMVATTLSLLSDKIKSCSSMHIRAWQTNHEVEFATRAALLHSVLIYATTPQIAHHTRATTPTRSYAPMNFLHT